jgi:hypothetical protein
LIKKNVHVDKNMKIKAVYDSGSNVSLVNQKVVDILKLSLKKKQICFQDNQWI